MRIINSDARLGLKKLSSSSVHLIFTSPPYYNAREEYAKYKNYGEYLEMLEEVFIECLRVLSEGRFIIVNCSPVITPRKHRNAESIRHAIPFDLHNIMVRLGFVFVDDIIWAKPLGAGVGRNKRFYADRKPLQYKPEPLHEYLLVYRNGNSKLIEYYVKQYSNETLRKSYVNGSYEQGSVWEISPRRAKEHPAVFPYELAINVIRYYSFYGDYVLDPFAGIGTTGLAAERLGRKAIVIERNWRYVGRMLKGVI